MSIGQIIDLAMKDSGAEEEYMRSRLSYMWAEVVGRSINRYTFRRYVEGRTLHVYITSASLKNEISYLKPQLVKRLNEAVGGDIIDEIQIH